MALDKVQAMVAYWDTDQRCRFANEAYAQLFGVAPEVLVGQHIRDLLGPVYGSSRKYIEGAIHGEPQVFEREFPNPAGGPPRHSLAHYSPDIVDGTVRGFFVLVTDVSTIKGAEQTLHQSEEQFRLTLEEAPIGMALVGTDGRFLRVNRALCEILGYSADELVGMTFQAVTHPDDLDGDLALAGQLARGEIPRYRLEKRYLHKDGAIVHAELNGSVLRGPDGRPIHFIAQIEDITERKRTEQEQLFLAELGPLLASSFDEDEIIEHVARLATRMIADFCIVESIDSGGQMNCKRVASRDPSHKWLVEPIRSLPLDRTKPYLLSEAIRSRQAVLLERPSEEAIADLSQGPEHLRLLKAMKISSSVAVPLVAGERLIGVIALIASTGTRDYDARDVRLAQELAWRTAVSIERARMYHAARKATKARDEVLAIVAHDLRNPLNTIAMYAELLRRRTHTRAGLEAEAGEAIQRSAGRMARLVEDLLDISRMEAGQLSVAQASLDTRALLAECVESQGPLARAGGLDLRLQVPAALPPVWADRDRLFQVLENLIGNALKFTGGSGCITVGAEAREREVCFWVRDTGPGIPPEHLPHLFDRFWQAGRAERQGAGLGLPIVKGVIEAHGGRVWVESTPGQGACFFFTVPAVGQLQ